MQMPWDTAGQYHTRANEDEKGLAETDEYNLEKILAHKTTKYGDLLFLVKWKATQTKKTPGRSPNVSCLGTADPGRCTAERTG